MVTVEARCPMCSATVRLPARTLVMTIPPKVGVPGWCTFTCPDCRGDGWLAIDEDQAERLLREGVQLTPRALARRAHPSGAAWQGERPLREGPPLTYDDLLDLHLLLERDGWFEQLLESIG